MNSDRPAFLIISQVYVPDPASVGQHVADAAAEMARRGYRVIVYASARGYDDPSKTYPSSEVVGGVSVRRLPLSSFGKSSIAVRLIAQWIFLLQATVRGLSTRNLAGMMVSTSPPFCGVAGVVIGRLRRCKVSYWVMDLNPDQMIALGKIGERSLRARVFRAFNRAILRRADEVVVLDRFMAERVNRTLPVATKMSVMPPWPLEDALETVAHADNPFRQRHGLQGKFVVMYSGNHSEANPITTVLDAAARLQDDPRFVFLFIGGGGGKQEVEDRVTRGAQNIRSLPYQPLAEIKYSLSAADVHIAAIGDGVVGIVHPCKVYGAMAVARPILLLGPEPCHVSDLIDEHAIGRHIRHGDVDGMVRAIREMADTPEAMRAAMGAGARSVVATTLGKERLCGRFCDVLQRGLPKP